MTPLRLFAFVLFVLSVPSHAMEKWLYHPTNLLVEWAVLGAWGRS